VEAKKSSFSESLWPKWWSMKLVKFTCTVKAKYLQMMG
jgi:hypothetical protein